MHRSPFIKSRIYHKFANPLAGTLYDNKKFQETCFNTDRSTNLDSSCCLPKNKSTPHSLQKIKSSKLDSSNPEFKSDALLKTSKITELSDRLSNPARKICTRSKWASYQSFDGVREGRMRREVKKAIKMDTELSRSTLKQQNKFRFPSVKVYVLDTVLECRDNLKFLKLDLKRYFEAFVSGRLEGSMFQELADLIEVNMEVMLEERNQPSRENYRQKPDFATKRAFYTHLKELQKYDRYDQFYHLLKNYCLPRAELRQIYLKDILNLLSIQLNQQFGLPKDQKYVLLNESGTKIQDFAEIKFSTKILYIGNSQRAAELYLQYLQAIRNKNMYSSKNTFRQALKHNFREQVTSGHIDQSPPPKSNQQCLEEYRDNVTRAQRIINFKNDKSSFGRVRLIQYLNKRKLNSKRQSNHSPTLQPHNQINQTEQKYVPDQKLIQQFRKLKRINDYHDASFKNDQECKNKLQLWVLAKENIYFSTKREDQRDKIFRTLGFINQNQKYEEYLYKTIDLKDFLEMRKIINCIGDKRNVVQFVDRYLEYDQYGEMQQEDLKNILVFIIGNEGKTSQMILKTVWSWLQKNGVITNQVIRRNHMQLLFERNKIVYYFLISLIFGTNDTTALDMAHEILI